MMATTARKNFPVFDCDSHVVEPPSVWDEYVPARSRAWMARSANFSNLFAFQRDNRLIRDPVEVFNERCFIGFESDETLVYRLWDVFQDVAIWSSDYPHHDAEDAWDGLHHMAEFNVPAPAQRKLMGENARRLYGIEPLLAVEERIEKYEPAILPW